LSQFSKLLNDRNVVKASENAQQLERLEAECTRLKRFLSKSVPESEFLREKQQYIDIIAQLTEENMAMRKIIGEYEQQEQGKLTETLYGTFDSERETEIQDQEAIIEEVRSSALANR
jgi:3-methyladenine DNA glycosylase Tag